MQKSDPHRAAYVTLLKSNPAPALARKSAALSQNTLSEEISGGMLLYWYLISNLDFIKRNFLKVKTHETIDILWLS